MEGSVFRSGQQLRVSVQLVRESDDFPMWSGRYDGELTDIFAIQYEIPRAIVNNLPLKLGRGPAGTKTARRLMTFIFVHARRVARLRASQPLRRQSLKDPSFAPA